MLNHTLSQPSSTSGFSSILNPNHLHTKLSSHLHYSFSLNPKKSKTPFPNKLSVNRSPHFEHFHHQNNNFTATKSSLSPPGMQFLTPSYVYMFMLAEYCIDNSLKSWIMSWKCVMVWVFFYFSYWVSITKVLCRAFDIQREGCSYCRASGSRIRSSRCEYLYCMSSLVIFLQQLCFFWLPGCLIFL